MGCQPLSRPTGSGKTLEFETFVCKSNIFHAVEAVGEAPLGDPHQVQAGAQHFADHHWKVEAEPSEYAHAEES